MNTRKELSEFMYKNSTWKEEWQKLNPSDLNIEEGSLIEELYLGVCLSSGTTFVECTFFDNDKTFVYYIDREDYCEWADRIFILGNEEE